MAIRAGNIFYFFFSAADQTGTIDAGTVVAGDVAYAENPDPATPYPQSLRLTFNLTAGATRGPQVRPPAPGHLFFIRDPADLRPPPEPADVDRANYGNWPTSGTLLLNVIDPSVLERMRSLSALPVVPNRFWFQPTVVTERFLFEVLPRLAKDPVLGNMQSLEPNTDAWTRQLIASFLRGRYPATLATRATPADDDLANVAEMPVVAPPGAAGGHQLIVTAASLADPLDWSNDGFENPGQLELDHPAHPANGAIPARLVYRSLRTTPSGDMIDAAATNAVTEAVLGSEPQYVPFRFTRTWKAVPECSIYLPSQATNIAQEAPSTVEFRQRLPTHGIIFVALSPEARAGSSFFRISLVNLSAQPEREMRWLRGSTAQAWRVPAGTEPIVVDVTAPETLHVIVRRRMGQEVVYDPIGRNGKPQRAKGDGCTYFSMRRAIRALVNNRIAGGRLNWEAHLPDGKKNTGPTRALVREALGDAASSLFDGGPGLRISGNEIRDSLRPVLEAFFPGPPDVPPGALTGHKIFAIWQSATEAFEAPNPPDRYQTAWLGGGGAGALVASGLAGGYTVNPGSGLPAGEGTINRNAGESPAAFTERIVDQLLAGGLEPGAELQFWNFFSAFESIRNRHSHLASGHSPTFLRYSGDPATPIVVLDQTGESHLSVIPHPDDHNRKMLTWGFLNFPEVWLAANWSE